MQLKRHTVTKTWRHGGKPQIKLSAGEITIVNIKIIIKPVNEATRWVIMTSIIIVGRCLLLPSFRRETEGTDCTWIELPSNYDPRRTRKSTTRRWRTARRPSTRRRFTSNQCMVPIEQSYDVKDHYCSAHYQIVSRKQTSLCYWINMLLCVRCQEKKNTQNKSAQPPVVEKVASEFWEQTRGTLLLCKLCRTLFSGQMQTQMQKVIFA